MATSVVRTWSEELYRFGILIALVVLSFLLQQGQLDGGVRDLILGSLRPAWLTVEFMQTEQRRVEARTHLFLYGGNRLAELEYEVSERKIHHEKLAELEQENRLLRQELSRIQGQKILLYRFYGSGSQWFLDGGSREGLQVGENLQREGSLVGVITEVYPHFSKLKTLQDKEWQIPVEIGTESARPKGVYDYSQGVARVQYIRLTEKIESGAPIRTLGDQEVPPNLLVGWVRAVEIGQDEATWSIMVEPVFSPDQLSWVEVKRDE